MGINLLVRDVFFEMLAYCFYLVSNFFDEKLCSFLPIFPCKLYDICIIEVANLLEAGFKNVTLDIFVHLLELM